MMTFYLRFVSVLVVDTFSHNVPSFYSFCSQLFLLGTRVVWSNLVPCIVRNGYLHIFLVGTPAFFYVRRKRAFLTIFFLWSSLYVFYLSRHLKCCNHLGGQAYNSVFHRLLFLLSCNFSGSSFSAHSLRLIFR